MLPSNTIIPGNTRSLPHLRPQRRNRVLRGPTECIWCTWRAVLRGGGRHTEHVATNFCISEGANTGFVDFVGLIDNGDVLLNERLAFIDIAPAPGDPDRDLEASDTSDESTGGKEAALSNEQAVAVSTPIFLSVVIVSSTSWNHPHANAEATPPPASPWTCSSWLLLRTQTRIEESVHTSAIPALRLGF